MNVRARSGVCFAAAALTLAVWLCLSDESRAPPAGPVLRSADLAPQPPRAPPGPGIAPARASDAAWGRQVGAWADEMNWSRLAAQHVDRWAHVEPEAAARWIAALPDGAERGPMLVNVGVIWAAQHPAEAAKFAAHLPPGAERTQMLTNVFQHWCSRDLAAASAWLIDGDFVDDADPAVSVVATNPRIVLNSPGTALRWAELIADPALRYGTIKAIIEQWSERDGAAAQAYVRAHAAFDVAQRGELLTLLGRPRSGE